MTTSKKVLKNVDIAALKKQLPSKKDTLSNIKPIEEFLPEDVPTFWDDVAMSKGTYIIAIEMFDFVQFLEFYGFRKIIEDDDVVFVRLENNVITEQTIPDIKDFVVNLLTGIYRDAKLSPKKIRVSEYFTLEALLKHIYKTTNSIFDKSKLEMIQTLDGEQYVPQKYENAFFFRDCWVQVTDSGCFLREYSDLPTGTLVWKKHVIDFDILPYKDYQKQEECQFKEFVKLITGKDNVKRERMLRGAIGYLMHPFFEGALRAILLTDVGSSLTKANGRTGKGMIAQAMKEMVSTSIVPAKKWRNDDSFNFQRVSHENKLVVLDDMPAGFHADSLYNVITEGVAVNKKFKAEFDIRAKILVNSNTMMRGDGDSTRGRFLEIEVDNFFSAKYKPIDHFGNNFFSKSDWDTQEWASFYWYMMNCSQINLADRKAGFDCGVQYVSSESIERKRVIQNIEEEFLMFMEEKMYRWQDSKLTDQQRSFQLKELRDQFIDYKGDSKYSIGVRKIREKLLDYCDYKKYSLDVFSNKQNVTRHIINTTPKLL